jgi:hypothetical protein
MLTLSQRTVAGRCARSTSTADICSIRQRSARIIQRPSAVMLCRPASVVRVTFAWGSTPGGQTVQQGAKLTSLITAITNTHLQCQRVGREVHHGRNTCSQASGCPCGDRSCGRGGRWPSTGTTGLLCNFCSSCIPVEMAAMRSQRTCGLAPQLPDCILGSDTTRVDKVLEASKFYHTVGPSRHNCSPDHIPS